jgi:hypothetical protein
MLTIVVQMSSINTSYDWNNNTKLQSSIKPVSYDNSSMNICNLSHSQIPYLSYSHLSNHELTRTAHSIDPTHEHASSRLLIQRVCSPPPIIGSPFWNMKSIHPTTNLLFSTSSTEINDHSDRMSNELSSASRSISHPMITTRRLSLIESDQTRRDDPKAISVMNVMSKKVHGHKRTRSREQQETKRQKFNVSTAKQTNEHTSKSNNKLEHK